ncbi:MAG: Lrp/AsnC family transcriptional regulator [Candidatus Hodarchaeales archaeon]
MPMVFVLINTVIGAEKKVQAALQTIEAVKEIYIVYGVYNIVVKVEAPSMDHLKTVIHEQIRKVAEVRSTLTMLVTKTR